MYQIKINKLSPLTITGKHTLLEEMETAGLQVEYQCRDGHCGACRCELVSGEVEEIGMKMAYTSNKEILPCICRAKSDVTLHGVNYSFAEIDFQLKAKLA